MTTFDDRERAFENQFVHDADVRFRVLARRNKALATWACGLMGTTGAPAAAYLEEVLTLGLTLPDDAALARRLAADLAQAGLRTTEAEVRAEMDRQGAAALAQEHPR